MVKDFLSGNLLQSVSSEVQYSAEAVGLVPPVSHVKTNQLWWVPGVRQGLLSWGHAGSTLDCEVMSQSTLGDLSSIQGELLAYSPTWPDKTVAVLAAHRM